MNDKITSKLTSGKFLLTVISGLVFAVLSVTGKLPTEDVTKILLIIIYAYFTRRNGESQKEDK